MTKNIDFYNYWTTVKRDHTEILDREKVALKELSKIIRPNFHVLDAGCGYGKFMILLKKLFPDTIIKGIDYSTEEVLKAKKLGLDAFQGDLQKKTRFKDSSFDIIYSGEVIEHLFDPDSFLEEMNRLLKKDGYLILTTPNLCAWFNRIFMLFGIQPLFLEPSTRSKLIGAGVLRRFKADPHPVGHVRIFNNTAMKDLLKENKFKLIKIKGATYEQGLPKQILFFDKFFKLFPTLSSTMVVVCKKI